MLILFEGLDKVGKSTLIKNFTDLSGMPVYKNPIKPTPKLYDRGFGDGSYFGAYEAARVARIDLVFDRSHITELAYAEVKRKYVPAKKFWANWEESNKHYVVVVYVDAPADLVRKRFVADKEDYVKLDEIEKIAKKYEEYFKASELNLVYIDGSHDKQRMLSQLIIQLQNLGLWTSARSR